MMLTTSVAKAFFALDVRLFGTSSWTETAGLAVALRPVDFELLAVAFCFDSASFRSIVFGGFCEQLSAPSKVWSAEVVDPVAEPPDRAAFTASASVSGVAIFAPMIWEMIYRCPQTGSSGIPVQYTILIGVPCSMLVRALRRARTFAGWQSDDAAGTGETFRPARSMHVYKQWRTITNIKRSFFGSVM